MCHFGENGEFHIMNHRSEFLLQTCYSITHSIAFRSHLTSKWRRQTPYESDPAPSLNPFHFGLHVVHLTNGTGSFWQAHCSGVMDSGDKCSPKLFRNTLKEVQGPLFCGATLRYSPPLCVIELCSLFFSITASKSTTSHKVIVFFCTTHAESEEQMWLLDVTVGLQPGYAVWDTDSAIIIKGYIRIPVFSTESGSLKRTDLTKLASSVMLVCKSRQYNSDSTWDCATGK